jgi:hypothetical protein
VQAALVGLVRSTVALRLAQAEAEAEVVILQVPELEVLAAVAQEPQRAPALAVLDQLTLAVVEVQAAKVAAALVAQVEAA